MRRTVFIILFLVSSILIGLYFDHRKNSMIAQHLQGKTEQLNLSYGLLCREYHNLSHLIYDTQINTKDVINIFKQAHKAGDEEKSLIREKLYRHLKDKYALLKRYDIRQLHFHLPDNRSFLRFHRPKKFGDDLSNIRATVAYVNRYKKAVGGYEEGRIFSGYRFVYPIFDEYGDYAGSVEVSFSMMIMVKEMVEYFNLPANFLIAKSVVDKKVFKSEKSKYFPSPFNGYYFEEEIFSKAKKLLNIKGHKPVSEASKQLFRTNMEKGKPFSLYDGKSSDIITFIPIKNAISKKVMGAVSIRSDDAYIKKQASEFFWFVALLMILIGIILYIVYRELRLKEELILNNKKLKNVIAEADSGIGTMDLEGNFLEVNQVYCDLLGYTKEELLKLSCIKLTKSEDEKKSREILAKAAKEGKVSKVRKPASKKTVRRFISNSRLPCFPPKKHLPLL